MSQMESVSGKLRNIEHMSNDTKKMATLSPNLSSKKRQRQKYAE